MKNKWLLIIGAIVVTLIGFRLYEYFGHKDTLNFLAESHINQASIDASYQDIMMERNPIKMSKCIREGDKNSCPEAWEPLILPVLDNDKNVINEVAGLYTEDLKRCDDIDFPKNGKYLNWKKIVNENANRCPGLVLTFWNTEHSSSCRANDSKNCINMRTTYVVYWANEESNSEENKQIK